MNKYECIFGFETSEGTIYKYGDLIDNEEYYKLTSSGRRFFMLYDLKFVI